MFVKEIKHENEPPPLANGSESWRSHVRTMLTERQEHTPPRVRHFGAGASQNRSRARSNLGSLVNETEGYPERCRCGMTGEEYNDAPLASPKIRGPSRLRSKPPVVLILRGRGLTPAVAAARHRAPLKDSAKTRYKTALRQRRHC